MEADDDMIVVVVADEDEKKKILETDPLATEVFLDDYIKTSGSADEESHQYDYLENAKKPEVDIKIERNSDDEEYVPGDDEFKIEPNSDDDDYVPDDDEYIPDEDENIPDDDEYIPDNDGQQIDEEDSSQGPNTRRFTMLTPSQQKSFVEELRQQYDLQEDEDLLINTLKTIMKDTKPPPPPQDFYIMNGIMFECVFCEFLSETIPAATRHYQERHGQRYLVCYACGVDFRTTTNLYKHEKRCVAPDAELVLKARAAFLGRKGRSRPYLVSSKTSKKRKKFPCSLCSAVFITKNNLESHENLHRGERPYRCHACPSAYTSYSALSRHTKKHTDVQFICDYCKRSFKIKAALVAHMDTHKPVRKHACSECNRRFAQKSALMLHINRVHKNLPPPCACPICPKRYPRMSLLKSHMKKTHGLSIITRKMFFKTLPTMSELEIKQSKIILKDKNELVDFEKVRIESNKKQQTGHIKIKMEQSDQEFEESYPEDSNEIATDNISNETSQDMTMDEFMQYMMQGNEDADSTIYIQNGEVIKVNNADENNIVFIVEPTSDGEMVIKTVNQV